MLRAGRRWPCVLGTVLAAIRAEVEACPPRRSGADVAPGAAISTTADRAAEPASRAR